VGPLYPERKLLSCIYYLLTCDSPVGYLHENRSDIVHFFQLGSPITYTLISPQGEISQTTLGPNIELGQQLQLVVPSGWWKASELTSGEFGLISEAVSPGFEYEDMRFISKVEAKRFTTTHHNALGRLCRD
jgi:predicted cupin superfamily sugar epimerase